MARQVLPIVGAVVGAFFGNPQLGWAIGAAIGNAVDPLVIKGPGLGDLAQQTSQEGGPRPIVFALSPPIAGNVIASGEPRVVKKKKSQGKGGPKVETESVFRTYAVGVCEGPIGGFVRVWRNSMLVYDVTANSIVSDEDNAHFLERARFFTGTFEQNPSPDLETLFGVGETPAHRGTAYMVMADEDLTDLRGAIPQWTFQVQRCGVATPVILAVNNSTTHATVQAMRSTDGTNFEAIETPLNPGSPLNGFTWCSLAHSQSLEIVVAVANSTAGEMMLSEDRGATWELIDTGLPGVGGWEWIARSDALGLFAALRPHATHAIATSPDGRTWTLRATPLFLGGTVIHATAAGRFIAGQTNDPTHNIMTSDDGITWTLRACSSRVYELDSKDNLVFAMNRSDLTMARSEDGGLTWTAGLSGLPFGCCGVAMSQTADRALAVSIFGLALSPVLGAFEQIPDTLGEQWDSCCYSTTFGGFYFMSGPGSASEIRVGKMPDGFSTPVAVPIPAILQQASWNAVIAIESSAASECSITVGQLVQELCERAGMPAGSFNTSDIDDLECQGFMVLNTYPVAEAFRSLSQVFFFDPANIDGVLHFIKRGGNSVQTITETDMLADEQEIEQAKRGDSIVIPRVLHLNYQDVDGGLAPNKQSSERAGDYRANGDQSLQSAVVMTTNQAARAVVINHKIMAELQLGELKFCLPDSFLKLVPSNPVVVQWQGHSVRAMIQRADTLDGYQEYTLVRDRQSAYVSEVEGIPPPPQTPPPSNVIGPTLIELLDIHILQDADDNVGLSYYVAISGVLEAWTGALVELSLDGGENYIDSATSENAAVMGTLLDELPDHPREFPDTVHSFRVQIQTPLAELEVTDLEGLLNRQNLAIVGNEIIQFAEADEVSEGVWELSYLLRGRKGTDTAQETGSAHPIGERFVLLERGSLTLIPAGLLDLGRTLTFRATSYGTTVESGTVVSMLYTGRSQIEREPAYVRARRDGTNAIVDWQGVGRLGGGAQAAHGARFDGYRITFDDGSSPAVVVDTSAQTLTQSIAALSSPITISVQQLSTLMGAGPAIEVTIT